MTTKQAQKFLRGSDRVLVLTALSYVNLGDRELDVLIYRHLRIHTQEESAKKFDCSVNSIQNWESSALKKCCEVWDKIKFIKKIATQK